MGYAEITFTNECSRHNNTRNFVLGLALTVAGVTLFRRTWGFSPIELLGGRKSLVYMILITVVLGTS